MNNRHWRPRYRPSLRVFLLTGIMLAGFLCLFPSSAFAHSRFASATGPQITSVTAGFNGKFRPGTWIPVQVSLANNGTSFDGHISITTPASSSQFTPVPTAPVTYQEAINLPPLSQKQVTIYISMPKQPQQSSSQLTIELLDTSGKRVARNTTPLTSMNDNELSIGLLTGNTDPSTRAISRAVKDIASATPQIFVLANANAFPIKAGALSNFDLLVINNFTASTLSTEQRAALQAWVYQGGTLVVTGGPEWQRTLTSLPTDLLPVTITGSATLPPGTHLLPPGIPLMTGNNNQPGNDTLPESVPVSVGTARDGSTIMLAADNNPLVAQTAVGQGQVYYLAYDPFLNPLADWDQTEGLWNTLIMHATGDRLLNAGSGSQGQSSPFATTDTSLQILIPNIVPSPWLILGLLLGYVFCLGPLRLLLIRRLKKRDWSWSIALSLMVIFSLLSYGLVLFQKGTAIRDSSISIVQLSRPGPDGSNAHINNYIGVFVPNQGDFRVHIPGTNLVQPANSGNILYGYYPANGSQQPTRTTIVTTSDGTDATLQDAQIWSLNTLVSTHDTHVSGGLISHLTLRQSSTGTMQLTGTVTNTLSFPIKDAYLLIGEDFLSLGNLPAGTTRTIQLPLTNSFDSSQSGATQSPSLIQQIASDLNVSSEQFGTLSAYRNIDQNNERQRHLAILASTMTGASTCYTGGLCYKLMIGSNGNSVAITSGQWYPGSATAISQKPLQLSDAPVTLIGWAPQEIDPTHQVTINGSTPTGVHETLLQAPLDVRYSGAVHIPQSLITSHVVDYQVTQNSATQSTYAPGIYCMDTGHLTFEMTLPTLDRLEQSNLSIYELPQNQLSARGLVPCAQQPSNDASRLQVTLYNWQTGNWDTQHFTSDTNSSYRLNIDNAQPYIGPGGRVLIQFANQDKTLGTSVLATPAMEMSGTAAG